MKRFLKTVAAFVVALIVLKAVLIGIQYLLYLNSENKKQKEIEKVQEVEKNESDKIEEPTEKEEIKTIPSIDISSFSELLENLGDDRILRITNNINITEGFVKNFNYLEWDITNENSAKLKFNSKHASKYYKLASSLHKNFTIQERDTLSPEQVLTTGNSLLYIRNTKNLSIVGIHPEIKINIDNQFSPVLGFEGNNNLTIKNLNIVHNEVLFDYCGPNAPVIQLYKNKPNVYIENCSLNGCGTEGIVAIETDSIFVNNSKIFNCSGSAISLTDVKFCKVMQSKIYENNLDLNVFDLFESKLEVHNTLITRNVTYEKKFLRTQHSNKASEFTFKDCEITENKGFILTRRVLEELVRNSNSVDLSNFEIETVE